MNLTSSLIFIPLLTGILLLIFRSALSKYIALAGSLIVLVMAGMAYQGFELGPQAQFILNTPWIESLGINFYVGMDGISLLLVMLTAFLSPLIILTLFKKDYSNVSLFYALILIMESALIGVFVARDAFLFYIFWELALIPIYFICLLWGGEDKNRITFKFFLYTLVGSLFMLLGIIYIYLKTANGSFSYEEFAAVDLTGMEQSFLFWAFFLAFAIKMPVFPFHTWQPDTYTVAPAQGTMLLSGIMLKMGIYGVIRWMVPIIPAGMAQWSSLAILLAIIGVVYASIIAIQQNDFKRLIAYSSIAHVGLIAAGIFTGTLEGLQGGIIQMLSHGLTAVGLFYVIDIIYDRTKSQQLDALGGIRNQAPVFTTLFVIIMLGAVALPMTSGFVGEYLLFIGVFKYNAYIAAVGGLSIILGAVYMLNSFQKAMLGEVKVNVPFKDVSATEFIVLASISFFVIYMGVYPKTFLELSDPVVKSLIDTASTNLSLK